jgi:uncharacterized protein
VTGLPFLDTNVLLRHLRQDHVQHSPAATALLLRIEQGELRARLSDIVIAEAVFTLQRSYKVPKAQIAQTLLAIINLPGVVVTNKRRYRDVFHRYLALNIPFPDAYLTVQMEQTRSNQIYSFDDDFDRVPGIQRIEP